MKVVIVGGVAAGASAAARLRRLDETAEIVLIERGPYISYANCGLPYHVGGVIPKRENLLVMSADGFAGRFRMDVRVNSDVTAINTSDRSITVRGGDGEIYTLSYDRLLLATGSSPVMMELPGSDPERVFPFWTIPDMDRVLAKIDDASRPDGGARRAIVVGGGFIGLEVAENLRHRGLAVTVVELAPQILPTLDPEMSSYAARELLGAGIELRTGRRVTAFEAGDDYRVVLDYGGKIPADIVIMSVGVKPNSEIAAAAGLNVGPRGHIIVDEHMNTSDPHIFAAGDVVEVIDRVTGAKTAIPLAGPANKQGRIAADNIAGRNSAYPGSFGAAVIRVGGLTVASVGPTERRLRQQGIEYRQVYTHPASSASYYPGGAMMHMKLLFALDGKILGAQAVGANGVDKRIDVVATAMASGRLAPELAELELTYAPPYSSAKDPVNFLGMIAGNVIDGLTQLVYANELPADSVLLDVREPEEFSVGTIPGAVNIPLSQLRARIGELDRARRIVAFCQVGLRGYVAERILRQSGFDVMNLSGGFLTYRAFHEPLPPPSDRDGKTPSMPVPTACGAPPCGVVLEVTRTLDVRAMSCPGPVVRLKKEFDVMVPGEAVRLLAVASFAPDLAGWLRSNGHDLVGMETRGDELEAVIRKRVMENSGSASADSSSGNPAGVTANGGDAAMILFSNDLDKALAAMIVACGMAAAGGRVSIFFTFWGLSVLRKDRAPALRKSLVSRMFGWMLPRGASRLSLSKMNIGGLGTIMMKEVMARENVPTLEELLRQARELGVRFVACEMAMNVMGLRREELIEVDEVAGVAAFADMARSAGTTLFI